MDATALVRRCRICWTATVLEALDRRSRDYGFVTILNLY